MTFGHLLQMLRERVVQSKAHAQQKSCSPKGYKSEEFDILRADAHDLQLIQLERGLTSVAIVTRYLDQISQYNPRLKAVLKVCPTALEQAEQRDRERRNGEKLGPLHGIPILVKDNMATSPDFGVDTTGGSYALVGAQTIRNSKLVQLFCDAGAIILGKTSLSEFAYYKGSGLPPGWSALGGQVQSAYTTDMVGFEDKPMDPSSPGGSSTGSAVSVSAGFCPLALGSDTTGSVVIPGTRAALYSMRVSHNTSLTEGVIPLTSFFDSIGPMTKSVRDLALALDVILPGQQSFSCALKSSWQELKIGLTDPQWCYWSIDLVTPNIKVEKQMEDATKRAYKNIQHYLPECKCIDLIKTNQIHDAYGHDLWFAFEACFRDDLEAYLCSLSKSKVRTLQEIIQFNLDYAELELPTGYNTQNLLVKAQACSVTSSERTEILAALRTVSRELLEKIYDNNDIDVIIGPADSEFSLLACASGYPTATMPLTDQLDNGRPLGLFAMAKTGEERKLVEVLSAFESTFPSRLIPDLEHGSTSPSIADLDV